VVLRDGEVVARGAKEEFTLERMISLMVGRNIDQLYPPRSVGPSTETVLEVNALSQPGIIENISFNLHKSEVLGVFGLMGAGRTELARILFGLDPFEQGKIVLNGITLRTKSARDRIRNGMAFLTEDRRQEGLLMDATIADNIALATLPSFASTPLRIINDSSRIGAVNDVAKAVRLQSGSVIRQSAKTLSGGNQQKVVLAKWLVEKPSVFVLDEATRGVDVGAKYEVYRIINDLAAQGTGVLFISSEIEELIGMCDRILVMNNGEIQRRVARGDFDKEDILRAALKKSALS
jgi:ribose transport system ATP-binding protein